MSERFAKWLGRNYMWAIPVGMCLLVVLFTLVERAIYH